MAECAAHLEAVQPDAFSAMPAAKPVQLPRPIKFDDAMRGAMRVPPPPTGKKAKRKVWRKKRR